MPYRPGFNTACVAGFSNAHRHTGRRGQTPDPVEQIYTHRLVAKKYPPLRDFFQIRTK
jgi:hypothetical protein